jgi:hypothetical protein
METPLYESVKNNLWQILASSVKGLLKDTKVWRSHAIVENHSS